MNLAELIARVQRVAGVKRVSLSLSTFKGVWLATCRIEDEGQEHVFHERATAFDEALLPRAVDGLCAYVTRKKEGLRDGQ